MAWPSEKENPPAGHMDKYVWTHTYFPPQYSFVVITRLDLLQEDRQTHQKTIKKRCSQKDDMYVTIPACERDEICLCVQNSAINYIYVSFLPSYTALQTSSKS